MEIKIEVAGARLDKALADLTPLSRAVANEQIKRRKSSGQWDCEKSQVYGQKKETSSSMKSQKWKRSAMKQKICP